MRRMFSIILLMFLIIPLVWADTGYVDPDGDITTEWTPTPSGTHYTTIDDGTTPNTSDYISTNTLFEVVDIFSMENLVSVYEVTSIKLWAYCEGIGSSAYVKGDISKDGTNWVEEQTFISGSTPPGWFSVTFDLSGSPWSQSDINNLRVKLLGQGSVGGGIVDVYAMYAEITYTPSATTLKGVTLKGVTIK